MLSPVWIEIPVTDIERASRFYTTVFEFTPQEMRSDDVRRTQTLINTSDDGQRPGISLTQNPVFLPNSSGPLVYLDGRPDINTTLEKITAAGGKVVEAKTSMGENAGYWATFQDTEGNVFALYTMN